MEIKDRVKVLRNKNRLTQTGLAHMLGVSNGNVGDWERGKAKPGADALVALAQVFDVSIDWLLTGENKTGVILSELEKIVIDKLSKLPFEDVEEIICIIDCKLSHKKQR